jgi:hypothetical protein
MRLDVGRVDHLRLTRSTMRREFAEKPFPDATFSPAHKTIIDGCRRSILGRTVAPPAAALEDMKNAADDAPVIDPLLAAHVPWQMRFDPAPLLITKPKQIAAHLPAPKSPVAGNQQSILTSTLLLGSRPSSGISSTVAEYPAVGNETAAPTAANPATTPPVSNCRRDASRDVSDTPNSVPPASSMSPSCFIVWVKKKRLHTHPRLRPPPNNVNENDLSVVHALLESTVAQLRLIAIMVYGLVCFFIRRQNPPSRRSRMPLGIHSAGGGAGGNIPAPTPISASPDSTASFTRSKTESPCRKFNNHP